MNMNKQFLGSGKSNVVRWLQHPKVRNGIFQWVETGMPNYAETPEYIISLTGDSSIWPVLGASSVYSPSSKRFLVILAFESRFENLILTPKVARAWNWTINWAAFGHTTIDESQQEDDVFEEAAQFRSLPDELRYEIS